MAFYGNSYSKIWKREYRSDGNLKTSRALQVTPDLIRRLGLEAQLEGHNGCVNCLEWNEKGTLLASGSDDFRVNIWDPFRQKLLSSVQTGHTGNIFSVKFLPSSNDSVIVSGAGDCKIVVRDLNKDETTHVFSWHVGRVKRLATAPSVPFMFWSAAEDGTVMQYDLRCPDLTSSADPQNVLINLNAHMGTMAEAKCLAINPLRNEMMAVGANDPFVRLYDRRMLSCKSISFPSESMARAPWERENLMHMMTNVEDFYLEPDAAQYYIAGHLPQKLAEYKRRHRTLASTYLNFSADGRDLLVNLGGEQIYLFDVNQQRKPKKFDLPVFTQASGANGTSKSSKEGSNGHSNGFTNGFTSHTNGFTPHCNGSTLNGTTNGVKKHINTSIGTLDSGGERKSKRRRHSKPLHPTVDAIKQKANAVFEKKDYNQAILLYNQAISMAPDSPILYGNRAAAYIKRNWDGDQYAALRDCHSAIKLDPDHIKAHFRLAKCLFELSWTTEANDCLQLFKGKFPHCTSSPACEALEKDIKEAILQAQFESNKAEEENGKKKEEKRSTLSEQEDLWRANACDYETRFCGHCNTTTDIKEANFFGSNGQYIVAGSDDGFFFIWDRKTANIVRVLRGDDSIVNCLQPHSQFCLLATSGIDPVVRLWSPRPEDGQKEEREVDNSEDAAAANQKRMNADPLEMMIMNMGYRITMHQGDGETEGPEGEGAVQCRPS